MKMAQVVCCMADWQFADWLLFWILETSFFDFEWDRGNLLKSAVKHGVTPAEVETVFRSGRALPLGIQIRPATAEERYGLVGPTLEGRLLQVAFVLKKGRVRVISARPAHRKERKRYEEILRKIT